MNILLILACCGLAWESYRARRRARLVYPPLEGWPSWNYDAILREQGVLVEWRDDGWFLTWRHGYMYLGPTSETIARQAAALFVGLYLRRVSAQLADALVEGYIEFLERQ